MIDLESFEFKKDEYEWCFEELLDFTGGFYMNNPKAIASLEFEVMKFGPKGKFTKPQVYQQKSLDFFVKNQFEIANAVCEAARDYFFTEVLELNSDFKLEKGKENIDVFDSVENVKKHISITKIFLHGEEKDGYSYIGVGCDCSWDIEHGFSLVMHKKEVINIGIDWKIGRLNRLH